MVVVGCYILMQGCPTFGIWQAMIIFVLKLAGQYTNNILLDVSTTVHAATQQT